MSTTPIATALDLAARAHGLPVLGVSVGDPEKRETWEIQLQTGSTGEDQLAALLLIQSFDAKNAGTDVEEAVMRGRVKDPAIAAMIAYIWQAGHGGVRPTDKELEQELAVFASLLTKKTTATSPEPQTGVLDGVQPG